LKRRADAVSTKIYIGNFTDFRTVYNHPKSKYKDNFAVGSEQIIRVDLTAVAGILTVA